MPPTLAWAIQSPITVEQVVLVVALVCVVVAADAAGEAIADAITGAQPAEASLGPDIDTDDEDEPEYIYRQGKKAKDVSLRYERDWKTGLSFSEFPFPDSNVKYKVSVLRATSSGYAVRFDENLFATEIWSGALYIEPNRGQPLQFPKGHATVYYNNQSYWDAWYEAEKKNFGKPDTSQQTDALYALREQ